MMHLHLNIVYIASVMNYLVVTLFKLIVIIDEAVSVSVIFGLCFSGFVTTSCVCLPKAGN